MTMEELVQLERIVKSSERVRDLGEVFTPTATVEEMLDLLPEEIWSANPSSTFFEPACGDGNFLIEILTRKLKSIERNFKSGRLPAGESAESAQFHALQALSSIYAVDISSENIIGGTVGHEVGARTRMLNIFCTWNNSVLNKSLSSRSPALKAALWIIEHNLIIGNMLSRDSDGNSTERSSIPLIEYIWNCQNLSVSIGKTTFGDVIASSELDVEVMLSLFPPDEPQHFWQGKAINIYEAERIVAPLLSGPVRNGSGRSD